MVVKREIIEIDEEKCDGCGLCIPNCPEGALQIIDGKAVLVSDLFCDGLGACIGHCPKGAIEIIEREAEPYEEKKVMEKIVKQGENVIKSHLQHLKEHGEEEYLKEAIEYLEEKGIGNPLKETEKTNKKLECGCPGSNVIDFREDVQDPKESKVRLASELRQWPIQLTLVPPNASYLDNTDLLVAADCVPFSYANFHQDFLKGRSLIIGCPKLDDTEFYIEKLTEIIKSNKIKTITLVHMEVPCCFGLKQILEKAIKDSKKDIELKQIIIGIKGGKVDPNDK